MYTVGEKCLDAIKTNIYTYTGAGLTHNVSLMFTHSIRVIPLKLKETINIRRLVYTLYEVFALYRYYCLYSNSFLTPGMK